MNPENKMIKLRAPELSDLDTIYHWENDPDLWHLSQNLLPFSRFDIEQFILQGNHDIYSEKQYRFMIEHKNYDRVVGCVDIFDFDATNKRAGVGILIDNSYRGKGMASQAMDLLIDYSRNVLQLHQLYCNILSTNLYSIHLFKKKHFSEIGVKKDWIHLEGKYLDELILQLIL